MVAPQRNWHGGTYVLSPGAERYDYEWPLVNGATVTTRAGERGSLIAISEGHGGAGFRICEWCGWGTTNSSAEAKKKSHPHLLKDGAECGGPLAWRSLAHPYETDLVEIGFSSIPGLSGLGVGEWRSILYALLEGASDSLDISRDDIDGMLYPKAGRKTSLVLFDTVPGGAGGALRIARSFPAVLETALARMTAASAVRRHRATAACGTSATSPSTTNSAAAMHGRPWPAWCADLSNAPAAQPNRNPEDTPNDQRLSNSHTI